jgi:pimeloyl-ACP methyl ester carboxylesterase
MHQLRIPIWREARLAFERAALTRDPVLRGHGVPRGNGRPVLLVPGFLAGDMTLSLMAGWLGRLGYEPRQAGIRANVDCAARAVARLESQLEHLVEDHGRPAAIVGHSRGGSMARILAVRRPELVDGIVCLGAPLIDQLAIHPLVRVQVETVALLGGLGVAGFFSRGCIAGPCCEQVRGEATAPFPEAIAFTSIYTRSDGVVDWRTCLDPAATLVEVGSSHCGMAANGEVFAAIARALAPRPAFQRPRSSVQAVRPARALAA